MRGRPPNLPGKVLPHGPERHTARKIFSLIKSALDAYGEITHGASHGDDKLWQGHGGLRGEPALGGTRSFGQDPHRELERTPVAASDEDPCNSSRDETETTLNSAACARCLSAGKDPVADYMSTRVRARPPRGNGPKSISLISLTARSLAPPPLPRSILRSRPWPASFSHQNSWRPRPDQRPRRSSSAATWANCLCLHRARN